MELRASRGDNNVLAASLLAPQTREGVLLEVGRSVDVNEQRRLLERYWNTEDPSTSDDQDVSPPTPHPSMPVPNRGLRSPSSRGMSPSACVDLFRRRYRYCLGARPDRHQFQYPVRLIRFDAVFTKSGQNFRLCARAPEPGTE